MCQFKKYIIKVFFFDREVSGAVADATVLPLHPSNPPTHIPDPLAFATSLYANSRPLQTPAAFHLKDFSQPACGARKKCQGLNALESRLQTMTVVSTRGTVQLHLLQVGLRCMSSPTPFPGGPTGLSRRCPSM